MLAACASDQGTPCRYDYQCYSNSCTLETCDGYLAAKIHDKNEDKDEEESTPAKMGECTPVCRAPTCSERLDRGGLGCLDDLDCDDTKECPEPCVRTNLCAE
jgi:hypothetical protein